VVERYRSSSCVHGFGGGRGTGLNSSTVCVVMAVTVGAECEVVGEIVLQHHCDGAYVSSVHTCCSEL